MTTPVLAVGIGNTTVKLGLAEGTDSAGWPVWSMRTEVPTASFEPGELAPVLPQSTVAWRVASVHRPAEARLEQWVQAHRSRDAFRLLTAAEMPVVVEVDAPDRVGLDRLAAAVAANWRRDRRRPAIVVDAGTALTVNLVTADGAFQGGVILPGFALTAQALKMGTDRLPLVHPDLNSEPPPVVGKSTEGAIRSGLFWGNVGAVREIIRQVQQDLDQRPQIFVTGGDARRLAGFVSADAQFVPDLVLAGVFLADRRSPS